MYTNELISKESETCIIRSKLASRKFWISVASFLSSVGTSIAGLVIKNDTITCIGIVSSVLSAAIYSACEAYIDAYNKDCEHE